MTTCNYLFLTEDVLEGYVPNVDELMGPGGIYMFEDTKALLIKLIERADVRVSGNTVGIQFLPAPGRHREAPGKQDKPTKRKSSKTRKADKHADDAALSRNDPNHLLARSLAHMLQEKISGSPERAEVVLKALDPGPAEVPVLLDLGKHLAKGSESKAAAVAVLKRAQALVPDNAEVRRQLAFALSGMGQTEDAFQEIEKALEMEPESMEIRQAWLQLREEAGHGDVTEAGFKFMLSGEWPQN